MTWQNPPKFVPTKAKPAKIIQPEDLARSGTEDGEQMALFAWAALNCGQYQHLKWLYAVPNGGFRHIAEAAKFVATGTRAGVPDICLPLPTNGYAGLYIELKIEKRRKEKDGGCSKEQLAYLEYLNSIGYIARVCYGWIEARDLLIKYLELKI